jgi:DNA-binding NarL/FixJ family response regulator
MPAANPDPQPLTILIADDHDLFATSLAETLAPYSDLPVVGRAADGAEAVALTSVLQPDVIVMDVSMPRLDGIVATREITDTFEETRVIVLSALTDAETASRARSAGAAAYLFKGCPIDHLVNAIREVGAPFPVSNGRSAPMRRGASSKRFELLEGLSAGPAVAH